MPSFQMLDQQDNEILLYVNAKKLTKRDLDPFGTEIVTEYRARLTPYIPGTRRNPVTRPQGKERQPQGKGSV